MIRRALGLWSLCLLMLSPLFSAVQADEINQIRDAMTLDQKIGQLILVGFKGLEAPLDSQIARDIRESHVGSVILFDRDMQSGNPIRNIHDLPQVQKLSSQLQSHADIPLFISIDQEGGFVARLKPTHGFIKIPTHKSLGKKNPLNTLETSERLSYRLSSLGLNLNFAPVVDVDINSKNPIIGRYARSFSKDPQKVTEHAKAFVQGHRANNVASVLKHFPGHGSSHSDSHIGFTDVSNTWTQKELIPFRKLIEQDKADMIMSAHVFNSQLDRDWPSTLSRNMITGLLREKLGYKGVVISDDMNMGAIKDHYPLEQSIVQALNAGVDILLFGNNLVYDAKIASKAHHIIKQAVLSGEVSQERIEESVTRVLTLKSRLLNF